MSDLLPLVAAVLKDKAAVDAQEEISDLRRQLKLCHSVEILSEPPNRETDVQVYASGSFVEGHYNTNPNLWDVPLQQHSTRCLLRDLRRVRVCVGGGFPLESMDDEQSNRPAYVGYLDRDDEFDSENSKSLQFCFDPKSTWLSATVHGWPRAEWERLISEETWDDEEAIQYLVDTVARYHPHATIEFTEVGLLVEHMPGAIQRLLPQRPVPPPNEDDNFSDPYTFFVHAFRLAGNQDESAVLAEKVHDLLSLLSGVRLEEAMANPTMRQTLQTIAHIYEHQGRDFVANNIPPSHAPIAESEEE